jgi:hypothetical protein
MRCSCTIAGRRVAEPGSARESLATEPRASVALRAGALVTTTIAAALFALACAHLPPQQLDDLCGLFAEKPEWREATERSRERWGVAPAISMAILHQESRFRAKARPGWRMAFGVIPVGPASSAYGYGQVQDAAWSDYRDRTGNRHAKRDDFADVIDFVGFYSDLLARTAGIAKDDAFRLYLGYHEGPTGFQRRSFDQKPWLFGVASKVSERAARYAQQTNACPWPPGGAVAVSATP